VNDRDDIERGERQGRWSRMPGSPLTEAQERALFALIALCPDVGSESPLHPIAERAELAPGPAKLALRGLERRRMAWLHEDAEGALWTPTQIGRDHAAGLRRPT
jgi:hypothetical protein